MNPGYPQMGQMPMQPMGGPMMGGPMGASPMMQRPVRRGTSRAVPVVVSAGLAVGVFCGLLFGLGTGKDDEASASPAKGNNVKKEDDAPAPSGAANVAKPAAGTGAVATKAAGSAAVATGSATGSATPTVATIKTAKLTVQVKPDGAAAAAKIQVDGKDITGTSIDIPVDSTGKKTVKVSITAVGFHSADKKVDIMGDETTLEIEMVKRGGGGGGGGTAGVATPAGGNTSSGGSTGGTGNTGTGKGTGNTGTGKGSGKGKGKTGQGGGGLIDI